MKKLSLVCFGFLVFGFGCSRSMLDTPNWSKPEEVAKSSDSLSTSFSLYKWNGSLLALGGDAGTYAARVWEEDARIWKPVSTNDPGWIPMDADATINRFVVSRATLWRDRLNAQFTIGSLSSDGGLASVSTGALPIHKTQLFPNAQPNLEMTLDERPAQAMFAGGIMEGAEIRVPYRITATPVERNGRQVGYRGDLTVSSCGVFASSNSGRSWRFESIGNRQSESPTTSRTKAFFYYFAKAVVGGDGTYGLWFSRCPVESAAWSVPETINKSVARSLSESQHAIGEGDTMHLCWLDARNEKSHLSLTRPRAGNYEVAYCRRKDSDAGWSKDVILSKGLRWSYAPSMSVEGNNVVVAWAGAKSDKEGRNEWNASDIYYVISKDAGSTWTKPVKITDGFKSGITSGRPQVALHKSVIHLFYVQGELNYQKVSAGMVKLNQPSWPILYQQRPFPN